MLHKRNYIYTNKSYSEKSVMSAILGIISLAALGTAVYFVFRAGGKASVNYGATVLLCTVFSVTGFVLGIVSKMEKDRFYLFSYVGIAANFLAMAGIGFILYAGVNGL